MTFRKNITILLAFIGITGFAQAQLEEPCGSGILHNEKMQNDSVYIRNIFWMEHNISSQYTNPDRSSELYTIPTVVHIIHEGEAIGTGSNISDAQILSAIEALNEDFRKMTGTNGDGDGVDTDIEFCLASRDPDGNSTNGIVRVNGSSITGYADNGIEGNSGLGANELAVKGLSTWDQSSYMNIWVVNEIDNNNAGSGVQGYAYFPTSSAVDGIVVMYNAFGTVGTLKPSTDMNRVITHEVGHYFSLYHTFHNTSSCTESSCSSSGDLICDTPPTILSSSCSSPACSGTQQVENYMDYTSETCRNMFTAGQKNRMRASIETQRLSLLSSLGCIPVSTYDAGISYIFSPSGTMCDGDATPEVQLTNYGSQTLTSVNINYQIDDDPASVYAWSGSLTSGQSEIVTLPLVSPSLGSHIFYASSSSPNGQTDEYTSNDESSSNFTASTGGDLVLEITIDFFGSETTWDIQQDGLILLNGGPYANNAQGTLMSEPLCLSEGCYTLNIYDAYNDGMSFTNGTYALMLGDSAIASGGGNFGSLATHDFCLTGEVVVEESPTASFSASDVIACNNASIDFSDNSSGVPTSWLWTFEGGSPSTSTDQNPQNINYNTSGTFDVTLSVTNAFGTNEITYADFITIYAPPVLTINPENVSCYNGTDGSVSLNITGNGGYSYDWNTGASSSSLNNIGSGSYDVTVTDINGCEATASTVVTQPTQLSLSLIGEDITCSGSNTGGITAIVQGGTPPYSYDWSNNATTQSLSNLSPGTYTLVVTDSQGCTANGSTTIVQSPGLILDITIGDVTCNGLSDGNASVAVIGGQAPYTYAWSNGGTSANINNVASGNYNITVTDQNGCQGTDVAIISQPNVLSASISKTNVSCYNMDNGSMNASGTGGVLPYSYSWSNGPSLANNGMLSPGSYTVTITDANGCTADASGTITQPNALGITTNISHLTCYGSADGSIASTISGGTNPYTFDWSNGTSGTSINNIDAGNYSLQVTDGNGCTASTNITVTEPDDLNLTVFKSDIACFGLDNGSVSASGTGGTAPFTFEWNSSIQGSNMSGLSQGDYTVVLTDANGCQTYETVFINEPDEIEIIAASVGPETCAGSDGFAVVTVTGGNGDYNFDWSNGGSDIMIDDIPAGNYDVTITDVNGCQKDTTLFVVLDCNTELPTTQLIQSDCGISQMILDDQISCDTLPGTTMYEWRFVNVATGYVGQKYTAGSNPHLYLYQMEGLCYGKTYEVSIKALLDAQWTSYGESCTVSLTADIPTTGLQQAFCGKDGIMTNDELLAVIVAGATSYKWTLTGSIYSNTIYTTDHILTISDEMLLPEGEEITVEVVAMVAGTWSEPGNICAFETGISNNIYELETPAVVANIYPNPNNGEQIFIELDNLSNDVHVIEFELYDSTGKLMESFKLTNNGVSYMKTGYQFDNTLPSGLYILNYTLGAESHQKKLIVR